MSAMAAAGGLSALVGSVSCSSQVPSSSSLATQHNRIVGGVKLGGLSFSRTAERRRRRWGGGIRAATAEVVETEVKAKPVPRLKQIYFDRVVPALKEEYKYKNVQEVPYVKKIVINCGVGQAAQNAKALESTVRDLALITGQKPVTTRARKAIAGFKLREGVPVGVCLTLRGEVMYSFLDRLVNLALPRTRDFQGVNPSSFDGKGNYTLGLPEQSVFPEIRFENIDKERGMDVNIISTARSDTEGQKLLALLGMPFKEGTGARSASATKKKSKNVYKGSKRR